MTCSLSLTFQCCHNTVDCLFHRLSQRRRHSIGIVVVIQSLVFVICHTFTSQSPHSFNNGVMPMPPCWHHDYVPSLCSGCVVSVLAAMVPAATFQLGLLFWDPFQKNAKIHISTCLCNSLVTWSSNSVHVTFCSPRLLQTSFFTSYLALILLPRKPSLSPAPAVTERRWCAVSKEGMKRHKVWFTSVFLVSQQVTVSKRADYTKEGEYYQPDSHSTHPRTFWLPYATAWLDQTE